MQVDTAKAQSQSCMGFFGSGGLTGANTGYATSGTKVIGTWEGMMDSITIKQETTLDTLDLYFTMRITLTNTASVPKNNIYYMRSVDPDNDQTWPMGSFMTKNTIEYQLPNAANAVVVSARGTGDTTSYVALGTADTNAKCIIYPALSIPVTTDLSTVMDGTYPGGLFAAGSINTTDQGIGLAFYVNHLAPVDSASDSVAYKTTNAVNHRLHPANQKSFTFFYAFSRRAVDSAIKQLVDTVTHVPVTPTAVNNINENTVVKVYPNPTHDMINITNLEATDKVIIYDMMGKAINANWMIINSPLNTFSLQNIAKGNYILIVNDANGSLKARVPIRKQ